MFRRKKKILDVDYLNVLNEYADPKDDESWAEFNYDHFDGSSFEYQKAMLNFEKSEFIEAKHSFKLSLMLERYGLNNIDKFMKRDRLWKARCKVLEPMAKAMSKYNCSALDALHYAITIARNEYSTELATHILSQPLYKSTLVNNTKINFKTN